MCCPLAETQEKSQSTPQFGVFLFKKNACRGPLASFDLSRKEQDGETGFYYYGARYLDPKTSRWISADPAMGEYIPSAPVNDETRKRNENLPGMGGVFNYVNLHVYHYAGNNPVKYIDPDGRDDELPPIHDESYQNDEEKSPKQEDPKRVEMTEYTLTITDTNGDNQFSLEKDTVSIKKRKSGSLANPRILEGADADEQAAYYEQYDFERYKNPEESDPNSISVIDTGRIYREDRINKHAYTKKKSIDVPLYNFRDLK